MKKPLIIVFLILLIDQSVKFYVKTHMFLGEDFHILGNWFIINFTENNGMAYGIELEGSYGKLILSTFRIIAVIGIAWYLFDLTRKKAPKGLIISVAMIFAGAMGNIIDSAFYGIIFNNSNYQVAEFMPSEGGYSGFLHGKVVDMLYFPIMQGHFPQWFPFWGSEDFIFFRPIFNIADASITIGVLLILLFQKRFFVKKEIPTPDQSNEGNENSSQITPTGNALVELNTTV